MRISRSTKRAVFSALCGFVTGFWVFVTFGLVLGVTVGELHYIPGGIGAVVVVFFGAEPFVTWLDFIALIRRYERRRSCGST